jgi:hypothetical protein
VDDVEMGGPIGDFIDASKRAAGKLRGKLGDEAERIKQRIADERKARMVRMLAFGVVVYLLWRG